MADKSNYADKTIEESVDTRAEYRLHLESPRAYVPSQGQEEDGAPGGAALHAAGMSYEIGGDWSWKPWRDKRLAEDFKTFRGVPAGAAELYGRVGYGAQA